MKFMLDNSAFWIDDAAKVCYEKYGLRCIQTEDRYRHNGPWQRVTSSFPKIEINSLGELLSLVQDVGHPVVVSLEPTKLRIMDEAWGD